MRFSGFAMAAHFRCAGSLPARTARNPDRFHVIPGGRGRAQPPVPDAGSASTGNPEIRTGTGPVAGGPGAGEASGRAHPGPAHRDPPGEPRQPAQTGETAALPPELVPGPGATAG